MPLSDAGAARWLAHQLSLIVGTASTVSIIDNQGPVLAGKLRLQQDFDSGGHMQGALAKFSLITFRQLIYGAAKEVQTTT